MRRITPPIARCGPVEDDEALDLRGDARTMCEFNEGDNGSLSLSEEYLLWVIRR